MRRAVIFDLDGSLYDTYDELGRPIPLPLLELIDGVPECLAELKASGAGLFLVTKGDRHDQQKKIAHLELQEFFTDDDITICRDTRPNSSVKGLALIDLVDELQLSGLLPESITVVGDRLDDEIFWGNFLECQTIRMLRPHGKYRNQEFKPRYHGTDKPKSTVTNGHELLECLQLPIFA